MFSYQNAKKMFLTYTGTYAAAPTLEYYRINFGIFETYLQKEFNTLDIDMLDFTKAHYQGYIGFLRGRGTKNTSVRTYARAIKAFLRYLYIEGYLPENVTANVKFPKADNKQVLPLTKNRVAVIIAGIQKSWQAKRNLVIFSLMLDCGLRCGEVVALNRNDIDLEDDFIRILDSKNNKSRLVPLPVKVRQCILEYLDTRSDENEALILDCNCASRITENAIQQVYSKLKRYDKDVHAHLLRHTFATSYIMGGGSLEFLRVLMGHGDYAVTKEYLHLATQMGVLNYDIYELDGVMFHKLQTYKPESLPIPGRK